ncbi:hypothetical protein RB620_24100 [Paenibacillus sp. LHD-117]|uniref:hypothetical protein n=1 Tax=Paenibacillus sp. LHD-117 TaxID=3071412 RepID=UPI0027E0E757|nr:hypothetical protein [Paenibacillus sp. LHD-117]MDQ6422517.1 hypothetical protein [Paenibacillus sp. LHD-117]
MKTTKRLEEYLTAEYMKFKEEVEAGEYIAPQKMTAYYDYACPHNRYAPRRAKLA